jgi:MFS transporter, PPP family, 3-phenylpropionic acid transporter
LCDAESAQNFRDNRVRFPTFAAFALLFAAMYAAFGVASPFWPLFFESRGLSPEQLGLLLAAGTIVRLFVGPLAGRISDMLGALRAVLATSVALAVVAALGLLPAQSYLALMVIACFQAAALTPVTTTADALAVHASTRNTGPTGFEYGWVRGIGSAAFVIGTLFAGQMLTLNSLEPSILVWLHAALLSGAIAGAALVPGIRREQIEKKEDSPSLIGGFLEAFQSRPFRYVIAISALVLGSHAMHDAFAVIRWNAAGLSPTTVSVLWSEAVAAEVLVFFFLGPRVINWVGPRGAVALAAIAGGARWVVMSQTTNVAAIALVQPFHGLTFALLHLACMRVIGLVVPPHLAATAQAVYAFGAATASAIFTYLSGILYGQFGAAAFLAMTVLCALAIPLSFGLPGRRLMRGYLGNS